MFNEVMKRGIKFTGAIQRGAKHIPKHLKDLDNFAKKASNVMEQAGNFAAVASTEFGGDGLRDAGNRLLKTSTHINNVRNGPTAGAVRSMVNGPQNRGADEYWTPPFAGSDF